MSHIQTIEIKNFKSIKHAKIEGCRRINVFVGPPNTGKSNILEAMSLCSDFLNSNKYISLRDICRFEELIGLFNDGDKQKKIDITINDFVYVLSLNDNNTVEYGVAQKKDILGEKNKNSISFIKGMTINSDGTLFNMTGLVTMQQPAIQIKKYQFLNQNFANKNSPKKLDFPFGNNLFEVIRYNDDLRKECGELFNTYNLRLAFNEQGNLKIQKDLDQFSVFQLPVLQVADTLQRLIFCKAAIETNEDAVLLFEEPEAHMFPPYISKFTGTVWERKSNQFFITTHSPYVINDFIENCKEELNIYLVNYDKGETKITKLSDENIDTIYNMGSESVFYNLEKFLVNENTIHA